MWYLTIAEYDSGSTTCLTKFFEQSEELRKKMADLAETWGVEEDDEDLILSELSIEDLNNVLRRRCSADAADYYDFEYGKVPSPNDRR